MKKIVLTQLVIPFVFLSAQLMAESTLKLEPYTVSIGGTAAFPMSWEAEGEFTGGVDLRPMVGVFVLPGFEVTLKAKFQTTYYSSLPAVDCSRPDGLGVIVWGIGVLLRYHFDFDWPVVPYGALGAEYNMTNFVVNTILPRVSIAAGILIPVGTRVAFDIGVPVTIRFGVRKVYEGIEISPGYIGLRVFI